MIGTLAAVRYVLTRRMIRGVGWIRGFLLCRHLLLWDIAREGGSQAINVQVREHCSTRSSDTTAVFCSIDKRASHWHSIPRCSLPSLPHPHHAPHHPTRSFRPRYSPNAHPPDHSQPQQRPHHHQSPPSTPSSYLRPPNNTDHHSTVFPHRFLRTPQTPPWPLSHPIHSLAATYCHALRKQDPLCR